jgi:hypothetical protein
VSPETTSEKSTCTPPGHRDSNAVMTAALAYAASGIPVFPCHPVTKRPLTKRGFKDATTDPATNRRWWSLRPDALIGG